MNTEQCEIICHVKIMQRSDFPARRTGLEQALNDTTANPGLDGSGYDVLAIAPYFGSVSKRFDGRVAANELPVTNDTIDEMLDYTRDGLSLSLSLCVCVCVCVCVRVCVHYDWTCLQRLSSLHVAD